MDYGLLYNTNTDFHRYVDRTAHKYNEGKPISVEKLLDHKLVQAVGDMYEELSHRVKVQWPEEVKFISEES